MDKELLKKIIVEQKETFEKDRDIIRRDIPENIIRSNKIAVIIGIRRCGKSTLLRQISKKYSSYNYLNFEDDRLLDFSCHDFDKLLESFYELYPPSKVYFFDEIQNIEGWEKFARRLFNEDNKLFITGSSAKLLSSEIATALTGRNLKIELYPFSFKEYLSSKKFPIKEVYTTKETADISRHLKEYVKYGGFPEVVKSKDSEELMQIFQDIILKDLIIRFKIRDIEEFKKLALYLISNTSKKFSYNNLKKILEFSNTSKVKNFVDFFKESYLLFTLLKFDFSIKKQIKNQRKIYAIDSGFVNFASSELSENKGRIIENIVYIELRRRKHELYYFEEDNECDFLIKEGSKITEAIQVTASLNDPKTKEREIKGLESAMKKFNLKKGYIITLNDEGVITNKRIKIVPLWKWLLELHPSYSV